MNSREKLTNAFVIFTQDYDKHLAGNKAAGTRARKALMEIKRLASALRLEISEAKAVA